MLYLHVAASFVEMDNVALVDLIVPVGCPFERMGAVLSMMGVVFVLFPGRLAGPVPNNCLMTAVLGSLAPVISPLSHTSIPFIP